MSYSDRLAGMVEDLEETQDNWRGTPIYSEAEKQTHLLKFIASMLAEVLDELNKPC